MIRHVPAVPMTIFGSRQLAVSYFVILLREVFQYQIHDFSALKYIAYVIIGKKVAKCKTTNVFPYVFFVEHLKLHIF